MAIAETAAHNQAFVHVRSGGMWPTVKKEQHFTLMYGTISNRTWWTQIGLLIVIKICCVAHKQCVILGWPISKLTQPQLFPDSPPVLSCVKSRGSESRENRVDSA